MKARVWCSIRGRKSLHGTSGIIEMKESSKTFPLLYLANNTLTPFPRLFLACVQRLKALTLRSGCKADFSVYGAPFGSMLDRCWFPQGSSTIIILRPSTSKSARKTRIFMR
jgi:hypothetical protein